MEDAATAEISRSQIWQWIHHKSVTREWLEITSDLLRKMIPEELEKIRTLVGADFFTKGKFEQASKLFYDMSTQKDFPDFLTLIAYDYLN